MHVLNIDHVSKTELLNNVPNSSSDIQTNDTVITKGFRTINVQIKEKKKDQLKSSSDFKTFFRLIGYYKRETLVFTIAMISLSTSQIGAAIVPYLSGQIIDCITKSKGEDNLNTLCWEFLWIFLISSLSLFVRYLSFNILSERLANALKNEIFEKFVNHDMEFFHKKKTGELLSRLDSDVATIRWSLAGNVSVMIRSVVLNCGCMLIMLYMNWTMALIILAFAPIFMVLSAVFSYFSKQLTKNYQSITAKGSTIAQECFANITTVKSFSSEDDEVAHFKYNTATGNRAALTRGLFGAIYSSLTEICSSAGTLTILWYGGLQVLNGEMSAGQLVSFMIYANTYSGTAKALSSGLTSLIVATAVAENLFVMLDHKSTIVNKIKNPNINMDNFDGKIEFKNVVFAYSSKKSVKVLNNFNLLIQPNEVIAICGSSGGGKSTIVSLIQRFYDIEDGEGELLMNDINIKEYDLKALHQKIGLVSQEPVLFNGTIEENIIYGVEKYTKNDLYDAAKNANCYNFIMDKDQFPEGFNTIVGEKGSNLSGGQKQRIAIARALIKKPKILIFDESTSALDAESEYEVQQSINNLIKKGNITAIIIAHRLSTIMNCKRIIVLKNGNLVEQGNHESLFQLKGIYYNLVKKQMKNEEKPVKTEEEDDIRN